MGINCKFYFFNFIDIVDYVIYYKVCNILFLCDGIDIFICYCELVIGFYYNYIFGICLVYCGM